MQGSDLRPGNAMPGPGKNKTRGKGSIEGRPGQLSARTSQEKCKGQGQGQVRDRVNVIDGLTPKSRPVKARTRPDQAILFTLVIRYPRYIYDTIITR